MQTKQTNPKPRRSRRRGNGEGSIYQRADGRWCGSVNVGYDAQGKRVRRTFYGNTKREVQEKMARMQTAKLDGTLGEPTRLTIAKFLDRWLEDSVRSTVRDTTYASYKGIVNNHIKPRIGGVALAKLTPLHVQGLYAAMERDGSSGRLRQLTHAVLRRSLSRALKLGMVPRNACDAVEAPRPAKKEIRPLDPAQAKQLLTTAEDDRLEALYVLALTTGLRLGELFGLQWADLDLEAGSLTVRRTLTEVNGKLSLAEPKTAKSRRKVDLPALAVTALWEHRRRMLAAGHAACEFVFCNSRGGALRRSHFHRNEFKPLLEKAGLPAIRFHDLRHTAATLLLGAGVHPKVVQERLGHSQIGITLDTYSHVLPTMQKEAAGRLDALFAATA